jgi:hypothetical protein
VDPMLRGKPTPSALPSECPEWCRFVGRLHDGRAGCTAGPASEKRPCTRSRWGEQGSAAAYGDSAITGLAMVPMTLHPALQEVRAQCIGQR